MCVKINPVVFKSIFILWFLPPYCEISNCQSVSDTYYQQQIIMYKPSYDVMMVLCLVVSFVIFPTLLISLLWMETDVHLIVCDLQMAGLVK